MIDKAAIPLFTNRLVVLLCWCLTSALSAADSGAVRDYTYRVIAELPHSRAVFTQGLEWRDGEFYVSGGGYGDSLIYRRPEQRHDQRPVWIVPPDYFAEGLTVWNERVFQLTWRAGKVFVYDRKTLRPLDERSIDREAWGLTHNDRHLILSDGSDRLQFLNPDTLAVERELAVTLNGRPQDQLNELEWVNGQIFANIWKAQWLAIIDPDSGAIVGRVDLTGLLPDKLKKTRTDVLNGIAYDPDGDRLWVTGKRWPLIYQIELVEPR